jgi:hypothetical protein
MFIIFRPSLSPIQPPVQLMPRATFQGDEWPERDADHSAALMEKLRIRGVVRELPMLPMLPMLPFSHVFVT